MATGWQFIDNSWYCLDADGAWNENPEINTSGGWSFHDGYWYYNNLNGSPIKGWLKVDNKQYFFDETGRMTTGWLRWMANGTTSGRMALWSPENK